ncbi:hypothetical protein Ddye_025979 [Dipteronia dyeriana]|uniref:Uncharacterized protein n=1 Tax=Dipteronia dyeriana TaxID=168575 RepID=A0AAD9TL95_9ROSI|nr:hypothetical protein Ddye_025979 [Dipteronia dyeriana]
MGVSNIKQNGQPVKQNKQSPADGSRRPHIKANVDLQDIQPLTHRHPLRPFDFDDDVGEDDTSADLQPFIIIIINVLAKFPRGVVFLVESAEETVKLVEPELELKLAIKLSTLKLENSLNF